MARNMDRKISSVSRILEDLQAKAHTQKIWKTFYVQYYRYGMLDVDSTIKAKTTMSRYQNTQSITYGEEH
jgi:hypothetical protein